MDFPERITEFQYRNNADFVNLVIPDNVKYIGPGAFFNCPNLETIKIPPTVKVVREGAFASCPKLTTVDYTDQTVFEFDVFNNCPKLSKIIKKGVEARVFSLESNGDIAVTIHDPKLSTNEYDIYVGRFADMKHFPNTIIHEEFPLLYFAEIIKNGVSNVWFSSDINMAVIGAQYKASGKSFCDFFNIDLTRDTKINYAILSLMIGTCKDGLHLWRLLAGRNTEELPLGVVIDTLQQYSQYFPEPFERLVTSYERSHEVFNYLDIHNIISSKKYFESLRTLLKKVASEGDNK